MISSLQEPFGDGIEERVAHVFHSHPSFTIKALFEWEDHRHAIDTAGQFLDPPCSPGPYLRADVIEHRHAGSLRAPSQGNIEIRVINENDQTRLSVPDDRFQLKVSFENGA